MHLATNPGALAAAVAVADGPKGYRHWSELRHHRPLPEGLGPEDLWALVKLGRLGSERLDLLRAKHGEPFHLVASRPMAAALHRIDTKEVLWKGLRRGGEAPDSEVSYRLMAAIEEAHHSSAIEGAVTTRRQSRELIRTKRAPRNRSERMVLNNFRAVQRLEEWTAHPLTPETICEVQAVMTQGTLEDPKDEGRIRSDDEVRIVDAATSEVVFVPPAAKELPERLERLCALANGESSDEEFLHPIVRAILVHHQLAYDHPFGDGNGRTARALVMWSILRSGYHWFRSLSISRAVHRAREQYYRAFRYVQSDEGDVTYFVRQQLRCIEQEIEHLARFLEERARLERWLVEKKSIAAELNSRQLALVDHALSHLDEVFTAKEHAQYHGVSQPTAWKDLSALVEIKLLEERSEGRRKLYRPTRKLRALAAQRPPQLRS